MPHPRRHLLVPATCAVAILVSAAEFTTASTQNQPEKREQRPAVTVHVPVRLVPVDVIVTDARDRSVVDLKQKDFQIFENGHLQEIRHFSVQASNAGVSQPPPPLFSPSQNAPILAPGISGRPSGAGNADSGAPLPQCSDLNSSEVAAAILADWRERIMTWASKGFERLSLAAKVVYQLAYYPEDERWDGHYRQIDVKVNRPNTKVSFRQGYYAGDAPLSPEQEELLATGRITDVAANGLDLSDIPFRISTAKVTDASGQSPVKVDLQIDPAKIRFTIVNDRHAYRLRVAIFYADAKGNYLGEDWKTMSLQLQEASYQRIMQSAIPFSTMIPLKAPSQILRVVVYDMGSAKIGSKTFKIK